MDTLHKEFMKILTERLEKFPDKADEISIDKIIANVTPEAVKHIKKSLLNSAQGMLAERRRISKEFQQRNIKRWAKAFDILETHIVICTEVGEEFNNSYRPGAVDKKDLIFDLIVRHHARACHISQEILCLLKSGYADAAHARWRALHEVNATAMFIVKHGPECAERFYFHDVIDSYYAMVEHKKYEHRIQEKGPSQQEIEECKEQYDLLVNKYGKKFSGHYGWASHVFPDNNRVGFGAIEKDVGLDHMRPYYKWASQNIHAGSKGLRNRLGLCESKEDILLVGQSNSGMTDPAHATAISLCEITSTMLTLRPTLDHIVVMKIIADYENEVGDTFLKIDRETS